MHIKVFSTLLRWDVALYFVLSAGCRSPSGKNFSDPFVSTCTVTPDVLKANTCVDFQKSPQCFLSLHGYKASDEVLSAAEIDILKIEPSLKIYEEKIEELKNVLAPSETRSIAFYSTSGFIEMNRGLRGLEESFRSHANIIYAAASGLNKLDKFAGTVFRTENIDAAMLGSIQQTFKVGNIVVEEVFLSTTRRASYTFVKPTRNHLSIAYTIQSKTGRNIKPVSFSPSEDEVLFVPGSAFRVLSFSQELVEVQPKFWEKEPLGPVFSTKLKIDMEEIEFAK